MGHEIVEAFQAAGSPLCATLAEMLDEHYSHSTERRGCGFTQATRFLADFINRPREMRAAHDLAVFADWTAAEIDALAARTDIPDWRDLLRRGVDSDADCGATQQLAALGRALAQVRTGVTREESHLFMALLCGVLLGSDEPASDVPGMPDKPKVGSCSQAEEYFLELAHGRVRRRAAVHIFTDAAGRPALLEKVRLGEAYSAIAIAPLRVFGVTIPRGSLCALRYHDGAQPERRTRRGYVFALRQLEAVRFLRLTTLAVAPEQRERAFGPQLQAQIRATMFSPATTTIEQLAAFVDAELLEPRLGGGTR